MSTILEPKPIGEISGTFYVPAYQRGYRWGNEEVSLLLNDLHGNIESEYCIQPVVVKEDKTNNRFELIDGQQRLTTIYLIFVFLKNSKLKNIEPQFFMDYETREESIGYLKNIGSDTASDEKKSGTNIDFFHMWKAYKCIEEWFDTIEANPLMRQTVADKLFIALCEKVKVIWYQVEDSKPEELFTRLNIGKIPLTSSELIKAVLLINATRYSSPELVELKQIEISTGWDQMEAELHDDNFWAFISNQPADKYSTRIDIVFDLIAGKKSDEKENYHTFYYFNNLLAEYVSDYSEGKKDPASQIWEDVLITFQLLKEWYLNHNLYHKIGYLIMTGYSLVKIVEWAEGCLKSKFERTLDANIRDSLIYKDRQSNIKIITELTYDADYDAVERINLLFNVETTRIMNNSLVRYPFMLHKKESWSLEHIHAQQSETLNTQEQWKEWLEYHREALKAATSDSSSSELIRRIDEGLKNIDGPLFHRLAPEVVKALSCTEEIYPVHGLGNMALLPGRVNSALNSSVFEVKRRKMVEMDKSGAYIPVCTRNVFLKYYNGLDQSQPHFWSGKDYSSYLDEMYKILKPYIDKKNWSGEK